MALSFLPQRRGAALKNLFNFDFRNDTTDRKSLIDYDCFNIIASKHTTAILVFFFT